MVLLVRGVVVCLMEFNKTVWVVSRWCCGSVGWACNWEVEGRRGEVVRFPVVRPLPVVLCAMGSRDVTGTDQYANTQHKYTIEIPGGSTGSVPGEGVVPGT